MNKVITDVDKMKLEIRSMMMTGYDADDILCNDIMRCIDRHTKEKKE